jgi:hypothetical protein
LTGDIGKAAGADKKLWRHLGDRFGTDSSDTELGSSPPLSGESSGMSVKLFYYLVATMNLVFPDYDFGDVDVHAFRIHPNLQTVINHVNMTLFSMISRRVALGEFTGRLWERVDGAIGLSDCEIYSFVPNDSTEELEDPFWERGCMFDFNFIIIFILQFRWSFNYFFWNKKLKRILLFTCRAVR